MAFGKPLGEAVDDLYAAFARVPAPVSVPYCNNCCVTDEEMNELLAFRPLREIPQAVLQPYAGNLVVSTAGSAADSQYFFPRILELAIGGLTWPDLTFFAQFIGPSVTGWPRRQRVAVRDLLGALWVQRLSAAPYPPDPDATGGNLAVEEILCTAAHLTQDLRRFLAHWLIVMEQPYPAAHLLRMLEGARIEEGVWRLSGQWWQGRDRPADRWLRSREIRHAVARRCAAAPDDPDAAFLATWLGADAAKVQGA